MDHVSRSTAIHEAAHAIANCRYGHGFIEVNVGRMDFTDCDGNSCQALGLCSGTLQFPHFHRRAFSEMACHARVLVQEQAFRFMVAIQAGPEAQARQSKQSRGAIALGGGKDDMSLCLKISEWLGDNCETLNAAGLETRRFVRDRVMWDAMNALADLLQARGRVQRHNRRVKAIIKPINRIKKLNYYFPNETRSPLLRGIGRLDAGKRRPVMAGMSASLMNNEKQEGQPGCGEGEGQGKPERDLNCGMKTGERSRARENSKS